MSLLERVRRAVAEDYCIERELGVGATASVYLAQDLKHDRLVALKVLRPELALAVGAERFLREIRTAAKLSHPGILPLYDSGEADGLLFFSMPVVEGASLRERLNRDGTIPVDEAVRVVGDVARALAYAHARGVVHRDVKPENLLLDGPRTLVTDFGIALAVDEVGAERLTQTGLVVGTPRYMSPEQAAGSVAVDLRSDIYSLGCVLYEMLTGRPVFDGPTSQAIVARHIYEPPTPVRALAADVPESVEWALEQALAKDPAERFPDAEAFAAALVDGTPVRRARPRARRRRWRPVALAAGVGVASLAGLLAPRAQQRTPIRERDWVLVADFDAPAAHPWLGEVVRDLVTTELGQSRYLTTMPRQQLAGTLRAAGLPETTTVNVELARELAVRSAVRAFVGGRVVAVPGGYVLTLRVVDAADGHELFSSDARATMEDVVPAVQRLAREARQELGERRRDIEADQPLLDIATPSLPAYRLYVDALARKRRGDVVASTRQLREALALDSGFAAAWALMGVNYVEARDIDSAALAFREALRRPERLSKAQRYRLLADAAYAVDRDLPGAVRWYDEYLAVTPRSTGGWNNRGLYVSMLGNYEEALANFERAADNNPFGPRESQPAIVNATDMLIALGHLDRAAAKARELTGPYAQHAQLELATASAQWDRADSIAVGILATPTAPPTLRVEATITRAATLAVRGAVRDADRLLAAAATAADGPQRRWYEQARSLLALTSGHRRLDHGTVMAADTAPGALIVRGVRLALLGDSAGARAAARRVAMLPARARARLGYGPLVLDALLDAHGSRWNEVVHVLARPAHVGEHDATDPDRMPSVTLRWLVAEAYAQLGRADSAAAYMALAATAERLPPGHVPLRGLAYPFAQQRLARLRAQRGSGALAGAE